MAGLIPQSFIDDLLNRTDIVDVVGSRIQLKKAGKNYTACCPFHNEKTPRSASARTNSFTTALAAAQAATHWVLSWITTNWTSPRRSKTWPSAPAWKYRAKKAAATTSRANRPTHRFTRC
jgi:hypothetical protein